MDAKTIAEKTKNAVGRAGYGPLWEANCQVLLDRGLPPARVVEVMVSLVPVWAAVDVGHKITPTTVSDRLDEQTYTIMFLEDRI